MAHDKLTAEGKKLKKQLEQLAKKEVKAGFQRGKAHKNLDGTDGSDIVDIVLGNEYGVQRLNIPARPFLKNSVENHIEEIGAFCEEAAVRCVTGGATAASTLKKIGTMQKKLIQKEIEKGSYAPNSPKYVEALRRQMIKLGMLGEGQKLKKKPLIVTKDMKKSVEVIVEDKGEES